MKKPSLLKNVRFIRRPSLAAGQGFAARKACIVSA